jgi:hypothetical protein
LIVALLALWPAGARAQAVACFDEAGNATPKFVYETWLHAAALANPGGFSQRVMTSDERQRFLSYYNNAPPVSDYNPERIEMFWVNWYNITVVFVENGCVNQSG